ncbi:hypothetical protein PG994_000916 [Apiospora phragmitis]|uniref:Uncharacterized protein n=1 Tax=Apiospora phragmitis TaxID=2905665 RepID=A0ABR1WRN5_9PEZI
MEEQRKDMSTFLSVKPKPRTTVDIVAIDPETVKCQKHYGFNMPELLNPEKHGHIDTTKFGMHRYIDNAWARVQGKTDSKSLQGSEMEKGEYADYSMGWTLDNCSGTGWDTVTISLYACGNDAAAENITDDGVEHVGDIRVDLKGLNWGQIPRKYASDNRSILYRLDTTVRMGLADEHGYLTVKVVRNGQELGTTDCKVQE